ncbi:hypothetical protein A3I51_05990 [Candidatus Gottesmanbacteria bacterium RIFCSPLOWO2_02_FULL_38_8]|uniref:Uncharacterized protein n=1 Tax=Candidatus Gottesmanbacteria bacterium RIFCSPLOWO2_02_FULL_38_8 TaxID=1798397 RepID=A0A1F6B625_9BACT|nr:MAG: hypothetical protein A3I51_05990 [Candidatus Gottesmanbacteria bacterium RIFCSPLOWO2_02_FULL_38_8]
MINIAPDLRQNLIVLGYLFFSHNYIALAYFCGMILGIILSVYRPSRFATFILLGFGLLLFAYEYDKHIIAGLREQTLKSLITVTPHYRLMRLVNLVLSDLLPVAFYILGWGMIFASIIIAGVKLGKKKN